MELIEITDEAIVKLLEKQEKKTSNISVSVLREVGATKT